MYNVMSTAYLKFNVYCKSFKIKICPFETSFNVKNFFPNISAPVPDHHLQDITLQPGKQQIHRENSNKILNFENVFTVKIRQITQIQNNFSAHQNIMQAFKT